MSTQTAEITTAEALQTLLRGIAGLSGDSLKRLVEIVEEMIEEEEENEDIAYIGELTPDDYASAVPLEEVTSKYKVSK